MGGFKHGHRVRQVGPRRNADAAHLRGQRVRDVVAVQVQRGDNVVLGRAQQNLLQEGVGDHVLDDDLAPGLRVLELAPRAAVDQLRTEFLLQQLVAPVAEATFRELHDVALVHQGQRRAVIVDDILRGLAHQALGAFARHGLDADGRGVREADLLHAELGLQELDQLLGLLAFGHVFNTRVDVFRVLAENHHIGLFGFTHRRGHALEVRDRTQADVQVQLLAQRHVQRTDAAADRGGQRALDGHHVVFDDFQGFIGQPHVGAVDLGGLLARVDFHPVDLALAAVGLLHRGVDNLDHHRGDIGARAVAFDEGNDGLFRHIQREISVDRDLLAASGNLDMLVGHECSICSGWFFCMRRIGKRPIPQGKITLANRTPDGV
ncbi:Uncharacterised protein [Achromobacter kerstersii]|nr:Uncharacterised protein [Achromobacter kerstersii]